MKRKVVGNGWSIDLIYTERLECSILTGTDVFHGSEYGQRLSKTLKTGDYVRVTVEKVKRGRRQERER